MPFVGKASSVLPANSIHPPSAPGQRGQVPTQSGDRPGRRGSVADAPRTHWLHLTLSSPHPSTQDRSCAASGLRSWSFAFSYSSPLAASLAWGCGKRPREGTWRGSSTPGVKCSGPHGGMPPRPDHRLCPPSLGGLGSRCPRGLSKPTPFMHSAAASRTLCLRRCRSSVHRLPPRGPRGGAHGCREGPSWAGDTFRPGCSDLSHGLPFGLPVPGKSNGLAPCES